MGSSNHRRFCSMPFRQLMVQGDGEAYLCCANWQPVSVGDLSKQTVEEIWNGEKAREIRRSILDDSFKYCDADLCPFLRPVNECVQRAEDVADEELKTIIEENRTVMPRGPREIACAFDRSCNLSCPTCRTELIVEAGKRRRILELQEKIETEALKDAESLWITLSGDPFGSPFTRDWLRSMKKEKLGALQRIYLHSNGLLWTPETWSAIPEDARKIATHAMISIDAASPELYAVNRRGGGFEKLLENLEFIGGLRRNGELKYLEISMVVQDNNFREMPAFVRLGRKLGVDRVYFMRMNDWATFSPEEFARRAVHAPSHPNFPELGRILKDPIFREPLVFLGNLSWL